MQVEVVWAVAPRQVRESRLQLPDGATVQQALLSSGWDVLAAVAAGELAVSVWGRRVEGLHAPLRDGDRVELTRPLRVDPKVARRERFQRQGARAPGLFARRR